MTTHKTIESSVMPDIMIIKFFHLLRIYNIDQIDEITIFIATITTRRHYATFSLLLAGLYLRLFQPLVLRITIMKNIKFSELVSSGALGSAKF